ncbi:MAG: hypothetical protein ACTHQ3_01335 [Motilibacteraceae bacterium]
MCSNSDSTEATTANAAEVPEFAIPFPDRGIPECEAAARGNGTTQSSAGGGADDAAVSHTPGRRTVMFWETLARLDAVVDGLCPLP